MRVRRYSRAIVLAAVTAALKIAARTGIHGQTPPPPAKPNILLILLDEVDLASIGRLVGTGLMPNVKTQLVDKGFVFTESFSVASLGAPARASLLTGQYPHNHNVKANYPPLGGITTMNHTSTVATWLQGAGYRTGLVGRYVTGYGWWTPELTPIPGYDDLNVLIDPSTLSMDNYRMNINGTRVDWGLLSLVNNIPLYQTDIITYLAYNFINTAPTHNKPFFLTVSPVTFNPESPPYNE